MGTLALDVGNTTVGATWFDERTGEVMDSRSFPSQRDTLTDWLEEDPGPHDRVVLGSVGEVGAWLHEQLSARAEPVVAFHRGDQFPLSCDVDDASRVGVDRLAGCLGAYTLTQGETIVVDLGTAITVDWIDDGGVFRGGAIVPGRRLCADSLHRFTDRLPDVGTPDDVIALPGRNPEHAIRAGLDRGLPGLVEAIVGGLEDAADHEVPIWVTGGDAGWFQERSRRPTRHDPHLVARGLLEALRRSTP